MKSRQSSQESNRGSPSKKSNLGDVSTVSHCSKMKQSSQVEVKQINLFQYMANTSQIAQDRQGVAKPQQQSKTSFNSTMNTTKTDARQDSRLLGKKLKRNNYNSHVQLQGPLAGQNLKQSVQVQSPHAISSTRKQKSLGQNLARLSTDIKSPGRRLSSKVKAQVDLQDSLLITEDENPLDIDECCLDPSGKGLSDLRQLAASPALSYTHAGSIANYFTPQSKPMNDLDSTLCMSPPRRKMAQFQSGAKVNENNHGINSKRFDYSQHQYLKTYESAPYASNKHAFKFNSGTLPVKKGTQKIVKNQTRNQNIDKNSTRESIFSKRKQSNRSSPTSRQSSSHQFRNIVEIQVELVEDALHRKRQQDKLNQQLKKQLRYEAVENYNLAQVNSNLQEKIENAHSKYEDLEQTIKQMRIDILRTNQERVNLKEEADQELHKKDQIRLQVQGILQQQRVYFDQEAQKEQLVIKEDKEQIKQMRRDLELMKEEAELLKGETRRERAIENERLKEIKSCQKKLDIYFMQNLRSIERSHDEETKFQGSPKKKSGRKSSAL